MRFRKPTASNSNKTFRFTHVISGIDAWVDIIDQKNATLSAIDDSSSNAYAWQPFISYGRASNNSDTSYIDFKITFKNNSTGANVTQNNVAITVVDLDGSGIGSYREMVAASLPSTPKGILGSSITALAGLLRNTLISTTATYSNIDTNNTAAMAQIIYKNVNTLTLRVGVVGKIGSGGTTRQSSFYFKGFNSMITVLPVKLMAFNAVANESSNTLVWKTTSEENSNRFEVYRSVDGENFEMVGDVKASTYSQSVQSYQFTDRNSEMLQSKVYYRLKMVDNDGAFAWSHTITCGTSTSIESVFPNPSNGVINVSVVNAEEIDYTVEVVDAYGKVIVKSEGGSENNFHTFDITGFDNGLYFVRVSSEEAVKVTKFLKR